LAPILVRGCFFTGDKEIRRDVFKDISPELLASGCENSSR
jgi:hypothetical protein